MKLVDDAHKAWGWFSMRAMALALAIQGTWEAVPDDMKTSIPASWVHWLTMGLLVLGIAGRLVKQGPK